MALIFGALLGAIGMWTYLNNPAHAPAVRAAAAAPTPAERSNQLKEELERGAQAVKQKAEVAGQAVADATADARITAAIKAKFVASRDLSALSISVNTTAGIVTLSGAVPSGEAVSKAIQLAKDTSGVTEVISTLQVRTKSTP